MVSSSTAQLGIIRRARSAAIPPIIRYKDVRTPICAYLSDRTRSINVLAAAENMFSQRAADSSESSFRQEDAAQSIEVLHAIQGMANHLGGFDFHLAPSRQNHLMISGVDVSVRADLLVYSASKKAELQIGVAILRMTQDDAETEAARKKRREMGLYVATLARLHLDQNIESGRVATNSLCLSIDVQHGEVFVAPAALKRRTSDIESACRFIASTWDYA